MMILSRRCASIALSNRRHRCISTRSTDLRSVAAAHSPASSLVRHGVVASDGLIPVFSSFEQQKNRYAHSRWSSGGRSSFAKLSKVNKKGADNKASEDSLGASSTLTSHSDDVDTLGDPSISDDSSLDDITDPFTDDPILETATYEAWHDATREKLRDLSLSTDKILTTLPSSKSDIDSILQLMTQWKEFSTGITPDMHALSPFRKENPQYPPSEFMTSVTFEAATKCQTLLTHILAANKATPQNQVQAYNLAMKTCAAIYHPSSGDRSEDILEAYGEKFGGDMDQAPSIECYKVVLEGHDRSCSSYFRDDPDSIMKEGRITPGEKAWEILNLLSGVSAWGDLYLKPDLEFYSQTISVMRNTLLDWKGRGRKCIEDARYDELATKSLNVFKDMESLFEEQQTKLGELSLYEWHCILRAYGDVIAVVSRVGSRRDERYKQTVEDLLHRLEECISKNAENILLSVKRNNSDGGTSQDLMEVIQRIIEQAYTNTISSRLISNKGRGHFEDLNASLNNESNSQKIFDRMKARSIAASPETRFLFPPPSQNHYEALLECVCECLHNQYSTPESNIVMTRLAEFPHNKAVRLLEELEELHSQSASIQPIDGSLYSKVVWANCQVVFWKAILDRVKYFDVADFIQDMLQKIIEKHERGLITFSSYSDATKMFNATFRFYSKRSKYKGGGMGRRLASRTLRLFKVFEHWQGQSDGMIKPDEVTFSLILRILRDNDSIGSAQSFLSRMEMSGFKPNEKHYLAAMQSRPRVGPNVSSFDSPVKVESMLRHAKDIYAKDGSMKPTTKLFTACISAFGGSPKHNNISKILDLTNELNDLYEKTHDDAFKPDIMFYSAVLDALSKTKDDSALHHALRVLEDIETKHDRGDLDSGPSRFAYTSVLHAISKSSISNGAKMAEDLIQRMIKRSNDLNDKSILPDRVTYTALLQVLANSGRADATERAEEWFNEMKLKYRNGDDSMRPNKMTYTAMINCWSNRPEAPPERVERILAEMEEDYERGFIDSKPDAFVYGSIIKAWSKSRLEDKANRAWKLYNRMKAKYESGDIEMQPNDIIITSIIATCGHSASSKVARTNALKVLIECISEIKSNDYITTSPTTFSTLLKAIKFNVPDDDTRRPLASSIFQLCCREGQLDNSVLDALQRVQPELYAQLPVRVQERSFGMETGIPPKWMRNVRK
ncbi:hypothetical protein HJC23_005674 [Cyclotella cryptica]|uniref:Uncharacterized protein n=1 Tax=Cyclotella cryptica TaxID=29204 RepID=A0ABD3PCW1_9STRA|eukprot:CCRYP_015532-RA/>CCRYP_015532-RA protein AED:0.04 eAED:0.04 QI:288/1/1/1/0.5/0.33/3/147/1184